MKCKTTMRPGGALAFLVGGLCAAMSPAMAQSITIFQQGFSGGGSVPSLRPARSAPAAPAR